MIKNDTKELILKIDNKIIRYDIEIAKRDKEKDEMYLRILNMDDKLQMKTFLNVEVRMTQRNEIYTFNSMVLGFKGNTVIIKEPKKITKIQRRMNKRYSYKSDVEIIKAGVNALGESFNLSKGGLGFRSKDFFFTDEILFINLRCPIQRKIYNLEVTVKDQFVEEDGTIRYGVQFADWVRNEFDYLLKFLENREKNIALRKTKKENEILRVAIPEGSIEQSIKRKGLFNKLNLFRAE